MQCCGMDDKQSVGLESVQKKEKVLIRQISVDCVLYQKPMMW